MTANSWLARLVRKFPKAFCYPARPLKIGVTYDIETAFSRQFLERHPRLHEAIDSWVGRPEYLSACTAGASRVDLKGMPAGAVTETEAKYAAETLEKMKPRKADQNLPGPQHRRRRPSHLLRGHSL